MQTVSIFILIGASHCTLLAFVCYLQSTTLKTPDKLLTAILAIEALRLFCMTALSEGWPLGIWHYSQTSRLAIGPIFYLYTLSMVGKPLPSLRSCYRHSLPAIVLIALIFANRSADLPVAREYMIYLTALTDGLVFIGYSMAARTLIADHRRQLKRSHSAIEQINLKWLKEVSLYLSVMGVALVLAVVYLLLVQPGSYNFGATLIFSTITTMILCYVISLKGIQQSRVYDRLLAEELERYDPRRPSADIAKLQVVGKYQSSAISKAEAEHFYQLVLAAMAKEKLYLRPKLKLSDLADAVGLHPQQLSQVINQCAAVHFCDFVNRYRVDEAIGLLQSESHSRLPILEIGSMAGFNSPATFYKYFRRQTGKSPKRFLKEEVA